MISRVQKTIGERRGIRTPDPLHGPSNVPLGYRCLILLRLSSILPQLKVYRQYFLVKIKHKLNIYNKTLFIDFIIAFVCIYNLLLKH